MIFFFIRIGSFRPLKKWLTSLGPRAGTPGQVWAAGEVKMDEGLDLRGIEGVGARNWMWKGRGNPELRGARVCYRGSIGSFTKHRIESQSKGGSRGTYRALSLVAIQ